MKKNLLKRIGAVALAVAVSLTMGTAAFAAENPTSDPDLTGEGDDISSAGVVQKYEDGKYSAVGNTVRIDKEIVIFNTRSNDTVVYLPNVKFSYTIAAANVTEGTPTIKDEFGKSGKVKDGIADALTTKSASIEYSNTAGIKSGSTVTNENKYVTTNSDGFAAAGYFDIEFDASKFPSAGIYRYVITESEDSVLTREKAGVTNSDYSKVRYLDVYVQNGDNGLEIYGYVLFKSTGNNAADKSFDAADTRPLADKTNGFVSGKNDDPDTAYSNEEKNVDLYLTSNVKILKTIDGGLANKTNEFPFAATIANNTIKSNPIVSYVKVASGGTLATNAVSNPTTMTGGTGYIGTADGTATASSAVKLKDADYVYVYGIPGKNAASTVTTNEYNNTEDTYTVSAKYDSTAVNVTGNDTTYDMAKAATAGLYQSQTIKITVAEDVVEVINTLNQVSPTNVVMRFAPYLFILGAAIVLLVLMRRRRSAQDAE